MPIRPATLRDVSTISSVFAVAFHEESLHAVLFPHRNAYPDDYVRAWRHRISEQYWNYKKKYYVSYETEDGREVIVGAAEWTREGDGWEDVWGIKGRWDPRLLIIHIIEAAHKLHRLVFHNRASIQPTSTNPNPLTYWTWLPFVIPYVSKYFIPPSSSSFPASPNTPHFDLSVLGTLPGRQNKGYGRMLAAQGLDLARSQNVPAVVLAAENKEDFYRRCGFTEIVGYATEGEGNPLVEMGVAGGAVMWTKWPYGDQIEMQGGGSDGDELQEESVVLVSKEKAADMVLT